MSAPPLTWRALHVHYGGDRDRLLIEAVRPPLEELVEEGALRGHFFVRYGEHGPHLRIRLLGTEDALDERILPSVRSSLRAFVETHPSTSRRPPWVSGLPADQAWRPDHTIVEQPYVPETARYGGTEGLRISEGQFRASSEAVLDAMSDTDVWTPAVRAGTALKLHVVGFRALGLDLEEVVALLRGFAEHWVYAVIADRRALADEERIARLEQVKQAIGQSVRAQAHTLGPPLKSLWDGLLDPTHPLAPGWLDRWRRDMLLVGTELSDAGDRVVFPSHPIHGATRASLFDSWIHMTHNRLGIGNRDEAFLAILLARCLEIDDDVRG